MLTIVLIAIVVALLFDFLNGMNDAANSIATIVATRVFSPTMAVLWAAFWNFSAIFIFGVSVAHTMGEGIVEPTKINEFLIFSCPIGIGSLGLVVYSFRYAYQCFSRFDRRFDRSGLVYLRKFGSGIFRNFQNSYIYRTFPADRFDTRVYHDVYYFARLS